MTVEGQAVLVFLIWVGAWFAIAKLRHRSQTRGQQARIASLYPERPAPLRRPRPMRRLSEPLR